MTATLARLAAIGPGALSDAELLSLLGIAKDIDPRASHARLSQILSPSQAGRVVAALEIGRRAMLASTPTTKLDQPAAIRDRLWPRIAHLKHEEFWVLLMNARCNEVGAVCVSHGGLSHCSVLPREVLAPALIWQAPLIACAHNHPSGDPRPSPDDLRLELLIDSAAQSLGLTVVDHLVITESGCHSARAGLISRSDIRIDRVDSEISLGPPRCRHDRRHGRPPAPPISSGLCGGRWSRRDLPESTRSSRGDTMKASRPKTARNRTIIEAAAAGQKHIAIAAEHGISQQRVSAIVGEAKMRALAPAVRARQARAATVPAFYLRPGYRGPDARRAAYEEDRADGRRDERAEREREDGDR